MNFTPQTYKGIIIRLIDRKYDCYKAKRYTLNGTNQNVWIPNKHLEDDGTLKAGENIDYVFRASTRQMELAGYTEAIPGIKRKNVTVGVNAQRAQDRRERELRAMGGPKYG